MRIRITIEYDDDSGFSDATKEVLEHEREQWLAGYIGVYDLGDALADDGVWRVALENKVEFEAVDDNGKVIAKL